MLTSIKEKDMDIIDTVRFGIINGIVILSIVLVGK